jgi:hypothetical protein
MTTLDDVFEEVTSEEVAPEMEVDNSQETDVESEQVAEPSIGDDAIDEVDTLETEPTEAVEPDTDGWQTILEEHGDLQVPLQVDGQTIYRSLKDLPANAMMREDYSRKTAELSQAKSAAEWAYDVQAAFQRDPQATIAAFQKAYRLDAGQQQQQQVEVDPYEDYDPDVQAVMRKMDEQNLALRSELEAVKQFQSTTQEREFRSGVEAELAETLKTFEGVDEMDVLSFATENRMRLPMAAEILWNRQQNASKATSAAASAKAKELSNERSRAKRQAGKDAVAATPKGGYDVESDAGNFSTIGELFELEMLKSSN